MSRSIRAAVATLLGAALAAPPVAIPQVALAEPVRDGVATPAACAPLGFQLDEPTQVDDLVLTGSRVSAHAPPPPPPPPPPPAPPQREAAPKEESNAPKPSKRRRRGPRRGGKPQNGPAQG